MEEENIFLKKKKSLILAILLGIGLGYYAFLISPTLSMVVIVLFLVIVAFLIIRYTTLALILFFFSLPFTAFHMFNSIPLKLNYFFFILFLISIFMTKKKDEFMKTPLDVPLFLFLFVDILSVFQSRYIPANPFIIHQSVLNYPWIKGITKIMLLLWGYLIYYTCVNFFQSKQRLLQAFRIYCSAAVFFSLFGIACFIFYLPTGHIITFAGHETIVDISIDLPRLVSIEQEPLFFGLYILTILPVIYSLLVMHYIRKEKNTFLFWCSIIMTLALFLTQSRSALLGFMVSIFTLFFFFKGEKPWSQVINEMLLLIKRTVCTLLSSKIRKVVATLLLILIVASSIVYYDTFSHTIEYGIIIPITGAFDSTHGKFWSTKTRLIAYEYAIDAFKNHPLLGIGYENYNFFSGNKYYYGLVHFNMNWPEVNNYPLKVLVELGIIGFICFLLIIVTLFSYLFYALHRTTNQYIRTMIQGYIASFIGISIIFLFSSNITRPYLWVSLAFAILFCHIGMQGCPLLPKENIETQTK